MMAAYSQHPNQLQAHQVPQQGPQQHIQGHPGQPNMAGMQQMHPAAAAAHQQAFLNQQAQQMAARQFSPPLLLLLSFPTVPFPPCACARFPRDRLGSLYFSPT